MLEEISTVRIIDKDNTILEQGKHCNHLWFIKKGAVKAFEWINGNERVAHFFLNNKFFTNYYCYVTKNKSDVTYKAVGEFEIIEIDYPKLANLCNRHQFGILAQILSPVLRTAVHHPKNPEQRPTHSI